MKFMQKWIIHRNELFHRVICHRPFYSAFQHRETWKCYKCCKRTRSLSKTLTRPYIGRHENVTKMLQENAVSESSLLDIHERLHRETRKCYKISSVYFKSQSKQQEKTNQYSYTYKPNISKLKCKMCMIQNSYQIMKLWNSLLFFKYLTYLINQKCFSLKGQTVYCKNWFSFLL